MFAIAYNIRYNIDKIKLKVCYMKTEIDYYLIGGLPGFSQDWFPVGWMRLGGCAAVTACDASIMLARDEGLTALCPCDPSHVTRQSYLDFADVMRPYLHPRWGGIDTLKIYIDGFGQYIRDVGADDAISLSGVEGNEPWETARDAIREQIDRGRVVPFLTLYHQNRKFAEYEWHWYNIAGYDDSDGFSVRAVTYAAEEWLDLASLWDTGYEKKGGIILIDDN